MKIKYVLMFWLLLLFGSANAAELNRYFPNNEFVGEASYLGADPEIERISNKTMAAIKKDSAWFDEYLGKLRLKPGEPLPYHPRLGITKEEHALMLNSAGRFQLVSIGKVTVNVIENSELIKVRIVGDQLQKEFRLHLKKNMMETNRAKLATTSVINQDDETSPTGPWSGIQWKILDEDNKFSEAVAVGKLKHENRGIIYYDLNSSREGVATHFIVIYPL